MKKLLFILSIAIFAGCMAAKSVSVEKHQIMSFQVVEVYENELDYIVISGLIGMSAYSYKTVEIANDNQVKTIKMYAELAVLNKNGSGSFSITIPIEKNISKIYFGDNEIIWERK
jgi:hypothetical protein